MKSRCALKTWLSTLLIPLVIAPLISCGTLLHPDRQGLKQGQVDPAVLVMDGVLLFVFVIPGLVAFGVDFYTGAIYLPAENDTVSVIRVNPRELDAAKLERILEQRTGVRVRLNDPTLRSFRLEEGADPAEALRRMKRRSESGLTDEISSDPAQGLPT